MICRVNDKLALLLLRLGRLCGGNGDVLGQVVGIPRLGRVGLSRGVVLASHERSRCNIKISYCLRLWCCRGLVGGTSLGRCTGSPLASRVLGRLQPGYLYNHEEHCSGPGCFISGCSGLGIVCASGRGGFVVVCRLLLSGMLPILPRSRSCFPRSHAPPHLVGTRPSLPSSLPLCPPLSPKKIQGT